MTEETRRDKLFWRFIFSIILLILSFAFGIFGLVYIENYSLLNAFYMTVITISTIGYGEIQPLSDYGKLFISLFIIYNVIVLGYVLSVLTSYFFEGALQDVLKIYTTNRKIKNMKNHVIICGFGRYGRSVCSELSYEKTKFVIIDNNEEKINFAQRTGYDVVEGSAMLEETLIKAGILNAAKLICCLPKGPDNVYITLAAKEINPKIQIIARSEEDADEKKLYNAGADYVVKPNSVSALIIARLVHSPEIVGFMQLIMGLSNHEITLETISYHDLKDSCHRQSIQSLQVLEKSGASIVGIFDKSIKKYFVSPSPDTIIDSNFTLIILGSKDQILKMRKQFCKTY